MQRINEQAQKDVQSFHDNLKTVQLLPEKTNYDLKRNLKARERILEKQTKQALLDLRAEIQGNEESSSEEESSGESEGSSDGSSGSGSA